MMASVSTVSTVSVMTSSMSVQPPARDGETGRLRDGETEGRGDEETKKQKNAGRCFFPRLPVASSPRLFISLSPRPALLRDLELARRDAWAHRAPVGRDEVNLVGVEL